MADVETLGEAIVANHEQLDVVINNAGVLRTADTVTDDGLDIRFAVNNFAPYLLTQRLLPLLRPGARLVNLSSAAQSPVNLEALAGRTRISDQLNAYAQSKLALTMWSRSMADLQKENGLIVVAVNPGSLLGTKMVTEGFGMAGNDIRIGADILILAALSEEFAEASGLYFDNDKGRFASPHRDALDQKKTKRIVDVIETVLAKITREQVNH
jgi:NAD(P)-dependent dehydrogenase (short-subunit alcohol dehydrogenase family)